MSGLMFAIEAKELLENDNSEQALTVCRNGIANFPDYPAGIIMMCEALFDEEKLEEAAELINNALLRFPRYKPLLVFAEKLGAAESLISVANELTIEEEISNELVESKSSAENVEDNFPAAATQATKQQLPDSRHFLKLVSQMDTDSQSANLLRADNPALIKGLNYTPLRATKRITGDDFIRQGVVFPDFYNPYDYDSEDNTTIPIDNPNVMNSYASETLAEILTTQGAFNQAIEVYNQLAQLNPDKKNIYDSRINEILIKIRD